MGPRILVLILMTRDMANTCRLFCDDNDMTLTQCLKLDRAATGNGSAFLEPPEYSGGRATCHWLCSAGWFKKFSTQWQPLFLLFIYLFLEHAPQHHPPPSTPKKKKRNAHTHKDKTNPIKSRSRYCVIF